MNNDYHFNEMIPKFWNKFNIVTRDHFYHSGGKIENRRQIVEALVCNFDIHHIQKHNHGQLSKTPIKQLEIFEVDESFRENEADYNNKSVS